MGKLFKYIILTLLLPTSIIIAFIVKDKDPTEPMSFWDCWMLVLRTWYK